MHRTVNAIVAAHQRFESDVQFASLPDSQCATRLEPTRWSASLSLRYSNSSQLSYRWQAARRIRAVCNVLNSISRRTL